LRISRFIYCCCHVRIFRPLGIDAVNDEHGRAALDPASMPRSGGHDEKFTGADRAGIVLGIHVKRSGHHIEKFVAAGMRMPIRGDVFHDAEPNCIAIHLAEIEAPPGSRHIALQAIDVASSLVISPHGKFLDYTDQCNYRYGRITCQGLR
jgi:hypothetical protein